MNLSQRSNHTDWTLSLSNLFWSEEPATTKNGSDVKKRRVEDVCPPLFDSIYLLCLSWIVLVHLLGTFFIWLLTPAYTTWSIRHFWDFKFQTRTMQANFKSGLFWARRPPCNFATNGLTRTVYQNIKMPVVPGRSGGGNFRGEEPISQRKTLPIECTQGDQAVRFPNRILVCSNVPSCGVLVVANFVSWWWSDVLLCCVMWCHAVSCHVLWCDAMAWNDMVCSVMWWDVVVWCVELGDDVLWTTESPRHRKTRGTSIPMRGATLGRKTQEDYGEPMAQRTMTRYYKELLRTTMFFSGATPSYQVLLLYSSVFQSTTPVLLRTTKYYSVL